jgi:transcriptional regulator with XRE-family HTH domain
MESKLDSVGLRIRHARKERKLTQAELAKAATIKQASLSELETGETKEISGPTLIALAKALGVRPEWIMLNEEPIAPDPAYSLRSDERELIALYRQATERWKTAIKYVAQLRGDHAQELAAESMNIVLARIAAEPVPDYKLGDKWTRPDKKGNDQS